MELFESFDDLQDVVDEMTNCKLIFKKNEETVVLTVKGVRWLEVLTYLDGLK
jgi:hypothetical protein